MKSDGIKRSVRANRHDRTAGDAPSMGRVARMPGTGLPKSGRSRRKRKHGESSKKSIARQGRRKRVLGWTFLFAGLAVLLMGLAVWLWLLPKISPEEEDFALREQSPVEPVVRVVSKFPSPSERDALALVRRALSIREPAEVAGFFRPCASSPEEIIRFLTGLEAVDGKIDRLEWLSSMDVNRLSIDGVAVSFKNEAGPRSRVALLTPDATGKWKMDFDAFARTVKPSWSEIVEKGAKEALVRVFVAKDSYYNGPFRDDTKWVSFGMASSDMEGILLGYCKVGSPQEAAMTWIFSKEAKLNRATLELRRVEGAEPRQFEISRVVAEDWVIGDVPFDEGFN